MQIFSGTGWLQDCWLAPQSAWPSPNPTIAPIAIAHVPKVVNAARTKVAPPKAADRMDRPATPPAANVALTEIVPKDAGQKNAGLAPRVDVRMDLPRIAAKSSQLVKATRRRGQMRSTNGSGDSNSSWLNCGENYGNCGRKLTAKRLVPVHKVPVHKALANPVSWVSVAHTAPLSLAR